MPFPYWSIFNLASLTLSYCSNFTRLLYFMIYSVTGELNSTLICHVGCSLAADSIAQACLELIPPRHDVSWKNIAFSLVEKFAFSRDGIIFYRVIAMQVSFYFFPMNDLRLQSALGFFKFQTSMIKIKNQIQSTKREEKKYE